MLTIILSLILALAFGYFATQNTQSTSVSFLNESAQTPLYIILGVTFLIGLVFSWVLSLFDSFGSKRKIKDEERAIQDAKKTNHELIKRANELEVENAKLKKQIKKGSDDISL